VVRTLANPIILRAVSVLFCAMVAFLMGLIFIRQMRKSITEASDFSANPSPSLETLPLHLYNTVIQQLKQQHQELQVQSQAEQQRARTSENFSQAVLANLSCGVLVFGAKGLVQTANPAAKAILGFASTTGMSPEDIFRDSAVRSMAGSGAGSASTPATTSAAIDVFPDETSAEPARLAEEIRAVLRADGKRRHSEAGYVTPSGERRFIAVTVTPVPAADSTLLGAACLISDLTELERIRRQRELHGEISAEMALQLRTSLATISGYAQQLANSRDPELALQLAGDIASEAAQLDRRLGGFLTSKHPAQGAAAGSSGV
jgi:PAS domain-containing protein